MGKSKEDGVEEEEEGRGRGEGRGREGGPQLSAQRRPPPGESRCQLPPPASIFASAPAPI